MGKQQRPPRRSSSTLILLFGVVLPVVAPLVELQTGICAESFFDPIPRTSNLVFLALVPLVNLAILIARPETLARHRTLYRFALGAALGVATYYSLVFLPLVFISLVAILVIGFGLLSLSPLLSLVATWKAWERVMKAVGQPPSRVPASWTGAVGVLLAMSASQLPEVITNIGLQRADSERVAASAAGVDWLRSWGDEEILLRRCYDRPSPSLDPLSSIIRLTTPVPPLRVRPIYYRVTGRAFNAMPRPDLRPPRWARTSPFDFDGGFVSRLDFDDGLGGATVANRVRGLDLVSSRIDGRLDADAGQGYIEWTQVLRNRSNRQAEARATWRLPADAVVGRVTLWIDGEEREAAFGGRRETREAYEAVVQRRRDPLLVTTSGRDDVLVQCFPVPASGEMKIRLGMSIPLVLAEGRRASMALPSMGERNFGLQPELEHDVWLQAEGPLSCADLTTERDAEDRYVARGPLPDAALGAADGLVVLERSADVSELWAPLRAEPDALVRARVRPTEPSEALAPRRLVLIVDGSLGMLDSLPAIAEFVERLPPDLPLNVLLATDEVRDLLPDAGSAGATGPDAPARVAEALRAHEPRGGCDAVPALERAWDLCAGRRDELIVWLHAPQPVRLAPIEGLMQGFERRPAGPAVLSVPVAPGPHLVETALLDAGVADRLPRLGRLADDLGTVLARLSGTWRPPIVIRERIERARWDPVTAGAREVSNDLARLWAHEEIGRLLDDHAPGTRDAALDLAQRHQLVTPVSGAVVLETQQQYDAAGLTPGEADSIPTVPEPEMVLLLALSGGLLIWMLVRRRQQRDALGNLAA